MGPFSWAELLVIGVVALVVIGPENLPKAAAQLGRFARQAKDLALGAKNRVQSELGPDLSEFDLKSLDPRQYDPRRIVRDAWRETPGAVGSPLASPTVRERPGMPPPTTPAAQPMVPPFSRPNPYAYQPGEPAPFDDEAT